MLKLMKYEWLRRRKLLAVILIAFAFAEAASVFGLYKSEGWLALTVLLMFAMFFVGMLLPLVDAVATYYSDFKKTHGYMLFLTPNNGYKIVGAKVLFALIELIATMVLVAGIFIANYHIAKAFGQTDIINSIDFIVNAVTIEFGGSQAPQTLSVLFASGVLQYFNTIMLAITALTIGRTLLSGKSYNWLVALAMYIGLAVAIQFIDIAILSAFGFVKDMITLAKTDTMFNMSKYFSIMCGLYVVWIGANYVVSSMLLNKRIDL